MDKKTPYWSRKDPFDTDSAVEDFLAKITLNTQIATSFFDRAKAASDIIQAPWLRKYTTTLQLNDLISPQTLELARGSLDLQITLYVDLKRCSVDESGKRVWRGASLLTPGSTANVADQLAIMEREVEKDMQVWKGILRLGMIAMFLDRELERLEAKKDMEDRKQHEVQDAGSDEVMQMLEEFFSGHDLEDKAN